MNSTVHYYKMLQDTQLHTYTYTDILYVYMSCKRKGVYMYVCINKRQVKSR